MAELLIWRAGDWVPAPDTAGNPLLVADSWLVEDGHARGIELHRRRFTAGCADATGLSIDVISRFWRAALRRLPPRGALFPRVELTDRAVLRLRIRPAPRRHHEIRAWLPDQPDRRRLPRRKGPDLPYLGGLRSQAVAAGADDALLLTPTGLVLESGTASLLWWDGDTLCVPDPALPVLPGVTATLVHAAAVAQGVAVAHRRTRLADLAGREAWLANALHGIRPVTAWVGSDVPAGRAQRAESWRAWWRDAAAPLALSI